MKQQRDKEKTTQHIIDIFYQLMDEKGYANVSTNLVAKKSGVSPGTLYHHFPKGKISIVKELIKDITKDIVNWINFAEFDETNMQKWYEEYLKHYIKIHRDNLEQYRAIDISIMENPELFEDKLAVSHDFVSEVVQKIYKKNEYFRKFPKDDLIDFLIMQHNVIESLVHRHLFLEPIFKTDKELISFITRILIFLIPKS